MMPSWNVERLRRARVLVAGAGALGNEIIKNCALVGIGHLTIVDRDLIETGNLSRAVLFRPGDEGLSKAILATSRIRELTPPLEVVGLHGSLQEDLGLGTIHDHDLVIAGLDNRDARVWLNQACARVHIPWIDGGIELSEGVVRIFRPPHYACYACSMSETDWQQLNEARSCTGRAAPNGPSVPTTSLAASAIAALQVQAAVQLLHGDKRHLGRGLHLDLERFSALPIQYPIAPDCPHHDRPARIVTVPELNRESTFAAMLARASDHLVGITHLRLSRPRPNIPELLPIDSPCLRLSPSSVGLPANDVVFAQAQHDSLGLQYA